MDMTYKNCIINVITNELADGSGWTADLYIAKPEGREIVDTGYFSDHKFPSEQTAAIASVQVGKRIIDGLIVPETL